MNKPKVGSQVQVVVQHFSNLLPALFPNEPKTLTYEGTVVQSMPEDDEGTFRMTGEIGIPTRVISMKYVISINGIAIDYQEKPKANKSRIVVVKGSKGDDYVVTVDEHGKAKCTCKGFGFRGKCSHIDKVLSGE